MFDSRQSIVHVQYSLLDTRYLTGTRHQVPGRRFFFFFSNCLVGRARPLDCLKNKINPPVKFGSPKSQLYMYCRGDCPKFVSVFAPLFCSWFAYGTRRPLLRLSFSNDFQGFLNSYLAGFETCALFDLENPSLQVRTARRCWCWCWWWW